MEIIRLILMPAIPVLLFFLILLGRRKDVEEHHEYLLYLINNQGIAGKFFRKSRERQEIFISQYGADYNLGITAIWQLMLLRAGALAIFFFIGMETAGLPWAFGIGILGTAFPDILIRIINREDNEKIFKDMKTLYDTLRIQQSAGIYITSSLMYCYKVVRCKRFKTALKQLSSDIMSEKDVQKAVSMLSIKFRNDSVDELVSIINQSIQTGQMVEMLNQIKKQMANIEDVMNKKKEDAIDRRVLIIIMLLFIGILAMVMLASLTGMTSLYEF